MARFSLSFFWRCFMYRKIIEILNKITNRDINLLTESKIIFNLVIFAKFIVYGNGQSSAFSCDSLLVDKESDDLKRIAALDLFELIKMLEFFNSDIIISELKRLNYQSTDYGHVGILMKHTNYVKLTKSGFRDSFKAYSSEMSICGLKPISYLDFERFSRKRTILKIDSFESDLMLGNALRAVNDSKKLTILNKEQGFLSVMNQLGIRYEKRMEFAADCFDGGSIKGLIDDYHESRFNKLDLDDRQKILSRTKGYVLAHTPLEIAKELFLSKITTYKTNELGEVEVRNTPNTKRENNISIENSLYLQFINTAMKRIAAEKVVIINASPFFVEKWIKSTNIETLFILDNPDLCYLLELHYEEERYAGVKRDDIRFATYDEIAEQEIIWKDSLACVNVEGEKEETIIMNLLGNKVKMCSVFGADTNCKNIIKNARAYDVNLFLLPNRLYGTTLPKYKSMALLNYSNQNKDVLKCKNVDLISENEGIQYLKLRDEYALIKHSHLISDDSLRSIIRRPPDTERLRNSARTINYSPEISICYSAAAKDNNGYIRGKAYVRKAFSNEKIKSSEVSYRVKPENLNDWLLNKYPVKVIKQRNGEEVSIRKIITKEVIDLYAMKPISLRTLMFITDNLSDYYSEKRLSELKSIIDGEIGNQIFAYATVAELNKILINQCDDIKRDELLESIIILSSIGEEQGYISEESLKRQIKELNIYKFGKNNISRLLSRRSLDAKTNRMIWRILNEGIKNEDSYALGMMLRLLTGLEPEAVCALTYRDIVNQEGKVTLIINKLVSCDGNEIIQVRRAQQARHIPLPNVLSQIVENGMNSSKEKYPCEWKTLPLLRQRNDCTKRISPFELNAYSKNILKNVGIKDAYIPVVNTKKQTKYINLSELSIDVFRGNISLWGRRVGGMFKDEINFILGLERETTAGKHYIDFNANNSQIRLRDELQIVENFFRKEELRHE